MDFPEYCRIAVQFCMLLSRASMRSLIFGKEDENPSMDFPEYCRIAVQFCMLLSRASMRSLIFGKEDENLCEFYLRGGGNSPMLCVEVR